MTTTAGTAMADPGAARVRRRSPGRHHRWAGTIVLLLVSAVAAMAFLWPFFVSPEVGLAHGQDAPWLFAVLVALLGASLLAEQSNGHLDAKKVAMLGVLAALGAGLRVLSGGVAGLEPMFFLVVVAGRVLGRRLAFLTGALTLLVSAFLTGGVGPWVPFQMMSCGWVALGAALLPAWRGRTEVVALSGYAFVAGLGYGAVMNLWFWPFLVGAPDGAGFVPGAGAATNAAHYAVFYLATSLGYDLPRGVLSAVLVALAGPGTLVTLRRAVREASFDAAATFDAAEVLDAGVTADERPSGDR